MKKILKIRQNCVNLIRQASSKDIIKKYFILKENHYNRILSKHSSITYNVFN